MMELILKILINNEQKSSKTYPFFMSGNNGAT